MSRKRRFGLVLGLIGLLPLAALAGTARLKIQATNEQGERIREGVFLLSMEEDPAQKISVGENDAGEYVESVQLEQDQATWKLTHVLVDNHLPVRVSIRSLAAGGDPVQEVSGMELNPSIPVPPITLVSGGEVRIELTLGERTEVMKRFLEARAKAAAAAEAEAAEQAGPPPSEAYSTALRLYKEGDVAGSLPHFEEAVRESPDDLELRVTYANVLYKAKRYQAFEKVAAQVLERDPQNSGMRMMVYGSARARDDMPAALAALLAVKKLGGGADLLQHLDFVAKKMGPTPAALPAYEAILELDPKNLDASVALVRLYAGAGDAAKTDRALEQVVALAPREAAPLYTDLASKLIGPETVPEADLTRAIGMLRRALELDAGFAPAYKTLGLALWKRQDFPGTRQAFGKYLELHPKAADREQIEGYLASLPE